MDATLREANLLPGANVHTGAKYTRVQIVHMNEHDILIVGRY